MKNVSKRALEIVFDSINHDLTNAEILAKVRSVHPQSTLTLATINYHRNQARKMNPRIKTEFEIVRSRVK
jgi:hypothetical protein